MFDKKYDAEDLASVYKSVYEKKLDPVGQEDKDIDNDGDHDKSDKYLLNRRKVRGSAIKTRKEEVELDENRRAARSAGGYKDDSKKQTDPSKDGFTGISGSIKDIMRQNKEIEAANKKKTKKEDFELWVHELLEEGYDLSDYTWDEMYDIYEGERAGIGGNRGLAAGGESALSRGGETAQIERKRQAQRDKANAAGARGPEMTHAAKFNNMKRSMPTNMRNSYEPEGDVIDEMAPMKHVSTTPSGQKRYSTKDDGRHQRGVSPDGKPGGVNAPRTVGPTGAKIYNAVRGLKKRIGLGDDYQPEGDVIDEGTPRFGQGTYGQGMPSNPPLRNNERRNAKGRSSENARVPGVNKRSGCKEELVFEPEGEMVEGVAKMGADVTDALPWNRNTKYTTKGKLRQPGENVHGVQTGRGLNKTTVRMGANAPQSGGTRGLANPGPMKDSSNAEIGGSKLKGSPKGFGWSRLKKEEVEGEMVEEGKKELSREKRNKMFRRAGNLSREALQGGDKGSEAHKKSGKIVKALNKDAEENNRNDVKEETLRDIYEGKKKGLWDNIHAKRKRGESPAKPGDKDYPKTLNIESNEKLEEAAPALIGVLAKMAARKAAVHVAKKGAEKVKDKMSKLIKGDEEEEEG